MVRRKVINVDAEGNPIKMGAYIHSEDRAKKLPSEEILFVQQSDSGNLFLQNYSLVESTTTMCTSDLSLLLDYVPTTANESRSIARGLDKAKQNLGYRVSNIISFEKLLR